MDIADFSSSKAGALVKALQGYWAFVPASLPPELELSWQLVGRISNADRALSELAGVARNLPNPHLLIDSFVRREAVLSSRIEGTRASLSDLFFFEAGGERATDVDDVLEVANYVKALNHGLARLNDLPVSLRLIREIHEQLMNGLQADHLTPGEFRRSQNWIGPAGCTLVDATYVPPPVQEMEAALGNLERYLHAESELPPLIRLALIHYQFEAIHPFLDGNGRVGRLLITLLLCHWGLMPQPLLYLSAFFERDRPDYYRLLLSVSQRGEWLEWITFFLRGVEDQSKDAIDRAKKLLDLWQQYRQQFQSVRSSSLLLRLVDELIANPVLTFGRAAALLNITPRAARMNVEKLVEAGIIREISGKQRYQLFIAPEIIHVLESSGE
ncbi:MAG: Fic family protein [Acidobacteria bacterium]|nr:Fic family protein [Acidobacteriota bacterium]